MQPQPVWKKRWSVGAKTPQIAMSAWPCSGTNDSYAYTSLNRRIASRCASGCEPNTTSMTRPCVSSSTFMVQSRPHIDATSSMSERIGPTYAP